MSYCRWSTPDCDLYCYESVGGFWATHVAYYRDRAWVRAWRWLTDKRFEVGDGKFRVLRFRPFWLPHWITHKRIRIKEAGETYSDQTIEDFYERVKWLKSQGFRVPDNVLVSIKEEISEGAAQ